MLKKFVSVLIVVCFVVSLIPATVGAASGRTPVSPEDFYGRQTLSKMSNSTALLYAYDRIVEGVEGFNTDFSVFDGTHPISEDEINMVFDVFIRDHVEVFWVEKNFSFILNSKTILRVSPFYIYSATQTAQMKAEIDSVVQEILSGVTSDMSDFEVELYLHDSIVERVFYDDRGDDSYTLYGALVKGVSVCEGYGESFQYLCRLAGIETFTAEGGGHQWSYVKINGAWYNVDLTWDDRETWIAYYYFNRTTAEIRKDHTIRSVAYSLPSCTSTNAFYYNVMPGNITSLNVNDVAALLVENDYCTHVLYDQYDNSLGDFLNWLVNNDQEIVDAAGLIGYYSYEWNTFENEALIYFTEYTVDEKQNNQQNDPTPGGDPNPGTTSNPFIGSPITISAESVEVPADSPKAEVIVRLGNIPTDLGLATCSFEAKADGGARVTKISSLVQTGSSQYRDGGYIWVDTSCGIFEESVDFAKITVTLPSGSKPGDVFNVTLIASDDSANYFTFDPNPETGEWETLGAVAFSGTKIVLTDEGYIPPEEPQVVGPTPVNPYKGLPVGIRAASTTVLRGTTKAYVYVSLENIPTDMGLAAAMFSAEVDGGATIDKISGLITHGSSTFQKGAFGWADSSEGVYEESVKFARITVSLPEGAKQGDVFNVTLTPSQDKNNYLTYEADPATGKTVGLGAQVSRNAQIIVTEYSPVVVSAPSITVFDGAKEATFDVTLSNIPADGLAAAYFGVSVPGAQVKKITSNLSGMNQTTSLPASTAHFMWADVEGVTDASITLATVTVSLPDGLEEDDVLPIVITAGDDPDCYLSIGTSEKQSVGYGATAKDGKITIESHVHQIEAAAAVEPGCETTGASAHYVCSLCGKTFSDRAGKNSFDPTIAALGHNLVSVEATAPSCDEPGVASHLECTRCGKLFADGTTAAVTYPATPDAGDKLVIKAPIVAVSEGTTTVKINIVADNISPVQGIASMLYTLTVDGDALISKTSNKLSGSSQFQSKPDKLPASVVSHMWTAPVDDGEFEGPLTVSTITITLPEDLRVGTVIPLRITPSADKDNFLLACDENGNPPGANVRLRGVGGLGVDGRIVITKSEVSLRELQIAPLGHSLTYHAATEPAGGKHGNIEYWSCDVCGKCFTDAAATNEVDAADVIIRAFKPGDVNGDGFVNSRDVILAMKASLPGFKRPADFIQEAADIDNDGNINARDVIAIMKLALAEAVGK